MKICISSGHGKYVGGATGYLNEVNEARRVVDRVGELLRKVDVTAPTFHDNVSKTQSENLSRITSWHNKQGARELDVSIHFNAYQTTSKPMGTECLYISQQALSSVIAAAISDVAQVPNRGAKPRSDLYFLNNTTAPAVLIEVVFVDSSHDAEQYNKHFESICIAIAESLSGIEIDEPIAPPPERPEDLPPPGTELPPATGGGEPWNTDITCTVFGGGADPNNSAYEPYAPIDDEVIGCALPYRFEGDRPQVLVINTENDAAVVAEIVDIGPWNVADPYWQTDSRPQAETGTDMTGRPTNSAGIDLTPAAAEAIGLEGKGAVHWAFVEDITP